jgi:transcriptional regulator with XRE-family HTH domain
MRHLRGWTLEEVAKRIGVKKTTVSQWETGRIQKLEGDNMLAVCKLFGTTPEQLLYGEEQTGNRQLVSQLETPNPGDPYIDVLTERLHKLPVRERLTVLAQISALLDAQSGDKVKEQSHSNGLHRSIESYTLRRRKDDDEGGNSNNLSSDDDEAISI